MRTIRRHLVLVLTLCLGALTASAQQPEDFATLQKRAAAGDAAAQNNLGDRYYYGNGVSVDYAQSLAWYRKAADQGNAAGQANLAYMYSHGRGVSEDDAQAFA
jgi:TPR repeat protein